MLSEYAPMVINVRCIVINHRKTASMYFSICRDREAELEVSKQNISNKCNCGLKGLSHEIDFKNFDKNLQNLV